MTDKDKQKVNVVDMNNQQIIIDKFFKFTIQINQETATNR